MPVLLLDEARRIVYGPELPLAELELLPLNDAGGRVLGYVGRMPVQRPSSQTDALFVQAQERMLLVGLGVSALLAVGLAWPLARILLAPLRRIAAAVSRLMARDFSVSLPEDRRDELGQLAGDVNRLAGALAEHGAAQRQWLTDLAHELRTPLAVMQAELEALEAGVQDYGPGVQRGLRGQTLRLAQLVDDLRELLATERAALRYEFRPLDLKALVADELDGLSTSFARAGLSLDFVADQTPAATRGLATWPPLNSPRGITIQQRLLEAGLSALVRTPQTDPRRVRRRLQIRTSLIAAHSLHARRLESPPNPPWRPSCASPSACSSCISAPPPPRRRRACAPPNRIGIAWAWP